MYFRNQQSTLRDKIIHTALSSTGAYSFKWVKLSTHIVLALV